MNESERKNVKYRIYVAGIVGLLVGLILGAMFGFVFAITGVARVVGAIQIDQLTVDINETETVNAMMANKPLIDALVQRATDAKLGIGRQDGITNKD